MKTIFRSTILLVALAGAAPAPESPECKALTAAADQLEASGNYLAKLSYRQQQMKDSEQNIRATEWRSAADLKASGDLMTLHYHRCR